MNTSRDWLFRVQPILLAGAVPVAGANRAAGQVAADLSVTKTDGVTTATPGGSVTCTITANNAGPNAATGATVADTFPAALTCSWTCVGAGGATCTASSGSGNINNTVNLPVGGSVTHTASCSISAAATGTLSNTATVSVPAGVTDPTPGNNSAGIGAGAVRVGGTGAAAPACLSAGAARPVSVVRNRPETKKADGLKGRSVRL